MAASIAVTREDLTAAQLRAASSRAGSVRAARRMLAMALVLFGVAMHERTVGKQLAELGFVRKRSVTAALRG